MTTKQLFFTVLVALAGIGLVGCGSRGPDEVVEAYVRALAEADADTMVSLSCAAQEETVRTEAASFAGLNPQLEGLSCRVSATAEVESGGELRLDYNGDIRAITPGPYLVVREGGWKVCGEVEIAE